MAVRTYTYMGSWLVTVVKTWNMKHWSVGRMKMLGLVKETIVGASGSDNKVSCIPYMREQRRACVLFWARGRCRGEHVRAWERQEARDLA